MRTIIAAGTTIDLAWRWSAPIVPPRISSTSARIAPRPKFLNTGFANPVANTPTVLVLSGGECWEHRVFRLGDLVDSPSLYSFSMDVKEMFDAA